MSTASETAISQSMGQNGFKYLSTAGTAIYNTTRTSIIQILEDATVSATSVRGDNLSSVALVAGTIIVGEFSSVTCAGTGGILLAYLSNRV